MPQWMNHQAVQMATPTRGPAGPGALATTAAADPVSSIPTRALVIPTRACIATPSAKRLAHSADAHLCRSLSFAPSRFGFARVHGDGMVLAAAPKQGMVWGFCDEGAAVTVSLDGGANTIKATIGPMDSVFLRLSAA